MTYCCISLLNIPINGCANLLCHTYSVIVTKEISLWQVKIREFQWVNRFSTSEELTTHEERGEETQGLEGME